MDVEVLRGGTAVPAARAAPLPLETFDRELLALIQSANLPIEHGANGTIIKGMAPRRLLQAA